MLIQKYSLQLVLDDEFDDIGSVSNSTRIYRLAQKIGLTNFPEEHVYVVFTDVKLEAIAVSEVSHGGMNTSEIDIRNIFKRAYLCNADGFIIIHNHPNGNLDPSNEDISFTNDMLAASKTLAFRFHDHIIVSPTGHMSMRNRFPRSFGE